MTETTIPPPYTPEEAWICDNWPNTIRVEHRQTGTDTAETYIHMSVGKGKPVCWSSWTFNKVAELHLGITEIARPKPGVREKVKARREWERKNARELADYKRLKAKFEGSL